ncbi:MAG: CHAD domain-containing protein [Candidatus Omnitrophica bacterium]|nr:CHAD domain-containing protein [Candidatus Omnitrophota bacterium]
MDLAMDSEGNTPLEIELKYTSEDVAPLELVLSKEELAGFHFRKLPKQKVIDRYYDTSDQDLRQNGLALRIRQIGQKILATVKSLGGADQGLHRREEIEIALPEGADPTHIVDGPIHDRIGPLIGNKSLREICEINQTRQRRMLSRDHEESVELSIDEVKVSRDGVTRTFFEIESELLKEGREEDLLLLKNSFDQMALTPVADSKLERALLLMGGTGKEKGTSSDRKKFGLDGDDTIRRGFSRILRFYYRRFLKYEKAVRKDKDIEDLHRMRVASRRIRAVIYLFRPQLRDSRVKDLDRVMRRATQQLGEVRDLDVLLEKLAQYGEEQKKDAQSDLEVLASFWAQRREKTRKDLTDYLDGSKFRKLREEFQAFFKSFPKESGDISQTEFHPEKRIRHVVPSMVWKAYEEVRGFETVIKDAPNETFHALRIEAKHLRYALEMFSEVLGEEADELTNRVVALQEHLGTLQDSEVTAELLKAFLDDPGKKWKGQVTPSVQKTLKSYRRHLEKIQRHQKWSFDEVWGPVSGEDFRKRLSDILSRL